MFVVSACDTRLVILCEQAEVGLINFSFTKTLFKAFYCIFVVLFKTIQNSVTTVINVASSELQSITWYSKVLFKSIPVAPNETPFQILPNY